MITEQQIKDIEKALNELWDKYHKFAKLKTYIDSIADIEYLSSGTARYVYKLNDDKVLKLAKNPKGIAQNETEADWALRNYGVAAQWYDVAEESIWIESEFCKKAKITDFKKLGYTFEYYCDCLRYYSGERSPNPYIHYSKPENYENTWDNDDLLSNMYHYIGDFDVPVGDLVRISSYGIDHEGNIVLVDTGLNNEVFSNHYKYKESLDQLVTAFFETRNQFEKNERPIYCYAKRKHDETGAIRKVSKDPYFVHPEGVAKIIKAYGGDTTEVQLGLAHDLLEDTYVTEDDIAEKFGDTILHGVQELTNDIGLIKVMGKEEYMNHKLVDLSDSALTVKLADIYYNLADYATDKVKTRIKNNIDYLINHRKSFKSIHLDLIDSILSLY